MISTEEKELIAKIDQLAKEIVKKKVSYSTSFKSDASPVTSLDILAEAKISKILKSLYPNSKIISEESYDQKKIGNYNDIFLVDPIDGTKEFIAGRKDYTLNICRIVDGNLYFSIVVCPELNEYYYAKKDCGAFYNGKKIGNVKLEKKKIQVVVSRSHYNDEMKLNLIASLGKNKFSIAHLGSSLKLCRVAKGDYDLYPRLSPCMEWDIAAGHLILNESGGTVLSMNNLKEIKYFKKDLLNKSIIASKGIDKAILRKIVSFKS